MNETTLLKAGGSIIDIGVNKITWGSHYETLAGKLANVCVTISIHTPSISDEDGYSPPENAIVSIGNSQKETLERIIIVLSAALDDMNCVVKADK